MTHTSLGFPFHFFFTSASRLCHTHWLPQPALPLATSAAMCFFLFLTSYLISTIAFTLDQYLWCTTPGCVLLCCVLLIVHPHWLPLLQCVSSCSRQFSSKVPLPSPWTSTCGVQLVGVCFCIVSQSHYTVHLHRPLLQICSRYYIS